MDLPPYFRGVLAIVVIATTIGGSNLPVIAIANPVFSGETILVSLLNL